jgi:hypothetical protein
VPLFLKGNEDANSMTSYTSVQLSYMKCKLVPSTNEIINVALTPKNSVIAYLGIGMQV